MGIVDVDWSGTVDKWERIRAVTEEQPMTVRTVADNADVAPYTARWVLKKLAEQGSLTRNDGDGIVTYRENVERTILKRAALLASDLSATELEERIETLEEQAEEYEGAYAAEAPPVADDITQQDYEEWMGLRRELAIAQLALEKQRLDI